MVMGNNKSATTNYADESLAISIAIRMWQFNVGCIGRLSTSRASGECLHRIAPAAVMVDKFIETTLNTVLSV